MRVSLNKSQVRASIQSFVTTSAVAQSITDGVTTTSPSEDAVYGALILKTAKSDLPIYATAEGALGDGSTDDYTILQSLITNNAGRRIIVGKNLSEVFIISKPLSLPINTILELNGTLKLKDPVTRSLTGNVSIGATGLSVNNSDGVYVIGQYVMVWDNNTPIQGGGATRQTARGGLITAATATTVSFGTSSDLAFTTVASAQISHSNSALVVAGSNVRISGTGVIDGNRSNHANKQPLLWSNVAEAGGLGIDDTNYDDLKISGVTVKSFILHGIIIYQSDYAQITDVRSYDINDKALMLRDAADGYINNVELNSIDEDGLSLYSTVERFRINNVRAYECARHGVLLNTVGTVDNVFNNLHLVDNYSPLVVTDAIGNIFNNIVISGDGSASPYAINADACYNNQFNNINIDGVNAPNLLSVTNGSTDISFNVGKLLNNPSSVGFVAGGSNQARISFNDIEVDGISQLFNISVGSVTTSEIVFRRCTFIDYSSIGNQGSDRCRFIGTKGTFKTSNSSTATIKSGRTFVAINHGLSITPIIQNFRVIPTNSLGVGFWITDISSTTFTINIASDPGATTATFSWNIIDQDNLLSTEVAYTDAYVSNFSAGVDGWTGTRATLSGNNDGISIGGVSKDDCLMGYATNVAGTHTLNKVAAVNGVINRLSFEYYIPTGQTNCAGLRVQVNTSVVAYAALITGQWVRVTTDEFTATSTTISFIQRTAAGGTSFTGANSASDDRVYLKNVVVETR